MDTHRASLHVARRGFFGFVFTALGMVAADTLASPAEPAVRVGVIGLDAHAVAWAKILAAADPDGPHAALTGMKIVAAVAGGSPDIPEKQQPLAKGIAYFEQAGIAIVPSIAAILPKVDAVMLLGVDGRQHLSQAREVIAAAKPLYIDKPVAASLADAREIYALAAARGVPVFSSSSLRFAPGTQAVRSDPAIGTVIGCDAHSPCVLEAHHPDLFWYGIHGVETLFTIMGPGCRQVSRTKTADTDVVVGVWADGRIGTFRGHRTGPADYGATVFGTKRIVSAGRFEGYQPLLMEIATFFRTGQPPVTAAETLEIIAFMEAAEESAARGGAAVPLSRPTTE